eukprot:4653736-Prymnesium_polylepis.1
MLPTPRPKSSPTVGADCPCDLRRVSELQQSRPRGEQVDPVAAADAASTPLFRTEDGAWRARSEAAARG